MNLRGAGLGVAFTDARSVHVAWTDWSRCVVAWGSLLGPVGWLAAAPAQSDLFSETVQPTLKQNCLGCHGEANTFANLDLRTREGAIRGGDRGPAIVSGNPAASLLISAIDHRGDLKMPPGGAEKRLAPEVREAFRAWVEAGASYTRADATDATPNWEFAEEDLWAFRPVGNPAPPIEGVDAAGVRTPVDSFVLARLAEEGIEPAPRADKVTLIRRVTYDLTGLPPTPEEVADFLNDRSSGAYKSLVERLLDSPRYGERWARHWLDVTRYADTAGYSNDFEWPNAWRYRDYVIRSFNGDKPYDRFVLEQIAGDELFPQEPEALIATGFLRTGPWEHTGMAVAAVTRQLFMDDVTHHVGQTFLAMTLGCARCHDHKFDPIPIKDYYRMQAVFAGTAFARRPLAFLPDEQTDGLEEGRAPFQARLAKLQSRMDHIHEAARQRLAAVKGAEVAKAASSGVLQGYTDKREQAELLKLLRKRVTMHKLSLLRFEALAMAVSNGLVPEWDVVASRNSYLKPEDYRQAKTHILVGGDIQSPAEEVAPGALEAVERYSGLAPPDMPDGMEGRRSALAKWIADPRNPLTARVMVNRIWQHHFGRGLAANANNFGKMGGKPSHPELLDWLATFFVQQGWSVKAVHRVILYSEVYQRSGRHPDSSLLDRADPDNAYLARFSPRRLTAEELRDSILAVSGELSDMTGGPGTYPQINSDVAMQPRHAMGTLRPLYEAEPTRRRRNRRSIYSFQQRSLLDPMVEAFNGANPDLTCERREASTVPTQAFALLNSEQSREVALIMAERLAAEVPGNPVDAAFRLAYSRPPTHSEKSLAEDFLGDMTAHHVQSPVPPRESPADVVHDITSELTGERFAFVQPAYTGPYEHNPHPSEATPKTRALADLALTLFNSNEFIYVY
ncbi:MAG: PSD1 and planctomycete cytochrome C domain-containing protein [Bryobacterales bacterium]|nr:PSD1 and planctomycete cytochrome C domain-containing protein [Bryobacterales bacterium]